MDQNKFIETKSTSLAELISSYWAEQLTSPGDEYGLIDTPRTIQKHSHYKISADKLGQKKTSFKKKMNKSIVLLKIANFKRVFHHL